MLKVDQSTNTEIWVIIVGYASLIMGVLRRFLRVPPFFVGTLCGGALYVYFYQNLRLKYHSMPQSIWNIMYSRKESGGGQPAQPSVTGRTSGST